MSLLIIEIFKDIKNIILKHKIAGVLGLLMPLAIGYIFYDTYIDETTKREVLIESEIIKNIVDNNCEIVYRNERRLISFCSEIRVQEKNNVKKVEQYLMQSGYKNSQSDQNTRIWEKGKMYIYEKHNDNGVTIFSVHYWKNIYTK